MLGVSDVNSDCVESAENSPTSPANTPELAGTWRRCARSRKESSMPSNDQWCFSPTRTSSKFRISPKPRPTRSKTTKTMAPFRRSKPSYIRRNHPPEDTLVASAEPLTCPRVESGDAALQAREGGLPGVRLLGADYMLYVVYQDGVHQNPGDHLDGGIAEYSKWQAWWKNLYICRPNATTHLLQKLGRDLLESCP